MHWMTLVWYLLTFCVGPAVVFGLAGLWLRDCKSDRFCDDEMCMCSKMHLCHGELGAAKLMQDKHGNYWRHFGGELLRDADWFRVKELELSLFGELQFHDAQPYGPPKWWHEGDVTGPSPGTCLAHGIEAGHCVHCDHGRPEREHRDVDPIGAAVAGFTSAGSVRLDDPGSMHVACAKCDGVMVGTAAEIEARPKQPCCQRLWDVLKTPDAEPPLPCPCGYTTECAMWCGDGSLCHRHAMLNDVGPHDSLSKHNEARRKHDAQMRAAAMVPPPAVAPVPDVMLAEVREMMEREQAVMRAAMAARIEALHDSLNDVRERVRRDKGTCGM